MPAFRIIQFRYLWLPGLPLFLSSFTTLMYECWQIAGGGTKGDAAALTFARITAMSSWTLAMFSFVICMGAWQLRDFEFGFPNGLRQSPVIGNSSLQGPPARISMVPSSARNLSNARVIPISSYGLNVFPRESSTTSGPPKESDIGLHNGTTAHNEGRGDHPFLDITTWLIGTGLTLTTFIFACTNIATEEPQNVYFCAVSTMAAAWAVGNLRYSVYNGSQELKAFSLKDVFSLNFKGPIKRDLGEENMTLF